MSLAVLPDRRVLHTSRTGEVRIHDPRTGLNTLAADIPVYEHDEEGLQGVAIDPNFAQNKWVYLYYSPPLDTPVDDPATPGVNEGDAPETGTAADCAPFKGALRLSRFKLDGDEAEPRQRAEDHRRARPTGASAATSAARSTSTARATCTCRPVTTPTRSPPTATSPIDERADRNPAFDAQRTLGQHQRPARQAAAHQGEGRRRLHGAGRQPVQARHGADPPGDLRDGAAQRVPVRRRPAYRRRVPGRLLPGRLQPEPGARAGRARPLDAHRQAGELRLAVLRDADDRLPSTTTSPPASPARTFNCKRPVNDSPHNTGQRVLPPVEQPEVWYPSAASALSSRSWAPAASARWAARRTTTTATSTSRIRWPAYYDGRAAVLRVDPRLHQGVPPRPTERRRRRDPPGGAVAGGRQPDGHGVRPGRRALRPGVRRRLLRREPGRAAVADRLRARQPDADPEDRGDARPPGRRR